MRKSTFGISQVLENEADEDMIERPLRERISAEIPPADGHVAKRGGPDHRTGLRHRVRADVHAEDAGIGAAPCELHGLRADAAAGFQDQAAVVEAGVVMKQLGQRRRLVAQALALQPAVAVDVG